MYIHITRYIFYNTKVVLSNITTLSTIVLNPVKYLINTNL